MASVQELIAAAQARQKPSMLSQLADVAQAGLQGYQEGQSMQEQRLNIAKQMLQNQQMQQEAAYQQQRMAQLQQGQIDGAISQGFKAGVNPPGTPPGYSPQDKLKHKVEVNSKGEITDTYENPTPEKPDLTYTPDQFNAIKSGDPAQMAKAFPTGIPKEALTASLSVDRSNATNADKTKQEDAANVKDLQNRYLGDKNVVTAQGTLDKLVPAKRFLAMGATNNTTAKQALQTAMAFVSTGGQRVNEQEMKQFLGGQTLTNRANQWMHMIDAGTLTPRDVADMQGVISAYEDGARADMQDAGMRYAKQLAQRSGNKPQDEYLRITGDPYQTQDVVAPATPTVPQGAPAGGQTPRYQRNAKTGQTRVSYDGGQTWQLQ